jgi:phage gp16-like protein
MVGCEAARSAAAKAADWDISRASQVAGWKEWNWAAAMAAYLVVLKDYQTDWQSDNL